MKGLMLPFATTLAVLITGVAIIIAGIILAALMAITGTQLENKFDFISLVSRSYDASLLLTQSGLGDRPFLERALESSVAVKKEGEFTDVSLLLNLYKYDYYSFDVYADQYIAETENLNNIVYSIDNTKKKCGENLEGVCVDPKGARNEQEACGVARVKIEGACGGFNSEVCCKESETEYNDLEDHYEIFKCGFGENPEEKAGYCTQKRFIQLNSFIGPRKREYIDCGNGRYYEEAGNIDCEGANNDETPVCCVPLPEIENLESGPGSSAEIPLLYKGKTLYEPKNYQCQNIDEDPCAGEYIRYHCPNLPPNIQCCITDPIHCMAPYEQYVCMDRQNCEASENSVVTGPNNEKLCPSDIDTYVCCLTTESVKGETPEQPLQSYGTCTLGDEAYNARPLVGVADIFVSGPLAVRIF